MGRLPGLTGQCWHIESRLHHLRDFTNDGDRCRAQAASMPRNPACLSGMAISIIRLHGWHESVPQASGRCAARVREAHDAVLRL